MRINKKRGFLWDCLFLVFFLSLVASMFEVTGSGLIGGIALGALFIWEMS